MGCYVSGAVKCERNQRARCRDCKGGQMVRVMGYVVQFVLLCTVLTAIATAQSAGGNPAPTPPVADRHATSESFDVNAAVDAYLAKMTPAERARSNASFERGYWLRFWGFLTPRH